MLTYKTRWLVLATLVTGLLLARHWFESGMLTHMAVQLPALALVGGWFAIAWRRRCPGLVPFAQRYRASLLLFALFTFGLWMLPRLLDAALHDARYELLKWLTLPLAGMALVLCWRQLPFVLRGILHLEALATLLRLGWLYLIAPQRYCVSYVLDEQQRLGYALLCYAVVYGLWLGGRIMFGGHNLLDVADRAPSHKLDSSG